jgi:NAD(P)-dependent dehydrogenase (short-subunit alcohol dehydrogenase family)
MNETIVVAGAGPGMGLGIARRFAREGFDVALIARNQATLDQVLAAMAPDSGRHAGFAADLTDEASIRAAFARIGATMGAVSVLAYNASVWRPLPAMQFPPDQFARDLSLCVTGALVAAQAVHPAMKARGGGTILLTGGGLALAPQQGAAVISLATGKAAMRGFGFALAEALRPDGIHVGMVTIAGTIARGTAFDPDRIADAHWGLHAEPRGSWRTEVIFDGKP